MAMELAGKTALVTGAGAGIGRAAALKFAGEGADVAVLSVDAAEVDAVAGEVEQFGRKALRLVADVSNAEQMAAAFSKVEVEFGQLDILFSNAGINGVWIPIEKLDVADWDRVLAINLRSTFLAVHHAIPLLRKAGGGAIVITSSINGTRSFTYAGSSAYGATKMAQISFMKSAALELARYKIRVNAICPGTVKTNIELTTVKSDVEEITFPVDYPEGMVPLRGGEAAEPEEIAELVQFLVSDRAKHITGTPIYIDGGQSLVT